MNIFANIPVPAANGSGAAVDMSSFGATKTVSVTGPFVASVTIEFSNEAGPTMWAPLITYNNPDGNTFDVACRWMRATVRDYKSGIPQCDVGSSNDAALFASLPVTAGNGTGAAVDVSALGLFKTVTVGGPFRGNVQLEFSEDGITAWSQIGFGFSNPGYENAIIAARWMRAIRAGVPTIDPGLPIVNVGATDIGGGDAIIVQDEGVTVPGGPQTTLNFVGGGVVASDGGGGVATITIPGVKIEDEGVPLAGAPHIVLNFVGVGVTASDSGGGVATITIPPAPPGPIRFSPPEQWAQQDVAAGQVDVDLSAQVSMLFDAIKMIRAGSIVGMATRLTEAVTNGTAEVTVTINGIAGTLQIVHSSGANPLGGVATQAAGVDTFVAGDLIGMQITTTAPIPDVSPGFTPTTTDLEAWLEIEEAS